MDVNEAYEKRHDRDPSRPWDAFWQQAVSSDSAIEDELDAARASRTEAEAARQRIADDILVATKEVCQRLLADGERAIEKARFLESEAEAMRSEAEKSLEQGRTARAEAAAYKDKVTGEAHQEAQAIKELARVEADRECGELRQKASEEAQKLIAQAEMMRTATREELEAQKIYTEAARLKAESNDVLLRAKGEMEAARRDVSESNGVVNGTNGHGALEEADTVQIVSAPSQDMPSQEEQNPPTPKRSDRKKRASGD